MHSFVPALWWAAILVLAAPSNSLRRRLSKLSKVDNVTKAPLPPPVSPVLPRSLTGGGEGTPRILRLKTEGSIAVSRLAPVAECDVTVGLDNGEAALLFSRSDVYEYACKQTFAPVDPRANLTFSCQHFRLKFNCFFESLTVHVDGKASVFCMDDQVGDLRGRNISLAYERNVMGFNGGYVCVVSCQGPPPPPPPSEEPACPACGVTVAMETKKSVSADQRIVGGVSTKKGDFPWMAHLKITASHSIEYMCGGSLVTDSLIISAAHCFEYDVLYVDVTLGMVDTKLMLASDLVRVRSTDFAMHPDYDAYNIYNDIAVIKLPKAVTFTDVIRPICLPATAAAMEGSVATATGWGTLAFYGEEAQVLQAVDLNVWGNSVCNTVWSKEQMTIASTQVCALANGKDTCSGDSGGPLAVQVDGKYVLLGITSYGQGCATPGVPGVYTRVSSYLTWINGHIEDGYCLGDEGAKRK